jgi:thiosulfate dehydrogenase
MRGFLFGIVFTLIVLVGTGLLAVTNGWIPVNADGGYLPFERWAASRALNAAIRREMPKGPPPIQPTSANLIAGIKLYAQNCEVCHGAADGKPTTISKGLYQHAPRLAEHGVEDDPEGETYWKIAHGIRWTGMPSFGKTLNDRQIWQLTLFLKHMDDLPADAQGVWRNVKNTASRQPKTARKRGA